MPSTEIAEVTLRKELPVPTVSIEAAAREHVLLMDGITRSKGSHDGSHHGGILEITVDVRTELLHRVLNGKDGRILASLGIEHSNAFHVLYREVDVPEYLGSLASRAEDGNGDGHADENGCYEDDYVYCHYCHLSDNPIHFERDRGSRTCPATPDVNGILARQSLIQVE